MKEFLNAVGIVFAAAVFMAALWTFFAIVGISEGSNDLCTESFKAAVTAVGKFLIGNN